MSDATVARLIAAASLAVVAVMVLFTIGFCRLYPAWLRRCIRAETRAALRRYDDAERERLAREAAEHTPMLPRQGGGTAPVRYAPLLPDQATDRFAGLQAVREAATVVEDLLPLLGPLYDTDPDTDPGRYRP
ncbi:hypothetical protein [Kitasatospora sp. NPDC090091]|uniref:hypothetical protein n=1 Tax=Kitasatospora sp. NPDC090091 TaxID=3364081 RepID=UPI00380ACE13